MKNRSFFAVSSSIICVLVSSNACLAGRLQNDREVAAIAIDYLRHNKNGEGIIRQASFILDSLPRVKYRLDDAIDPKTPTDMKQSCNIVEASTWPDRVSNRDDMDNAEARPTWHHIAIPIIRDDFQQRPFPSQPDFELRLTGKNMLDLALDRSSTLNIVQALKLNEAILKDSATPRDRRAIALCWFLNLMAELHQPTNTSCLFSKDFPKGDDFGTLYLVSDHGRLINWHDLWDSFGSSEQSALQTIQRYLTPLNKQRFPGAEDGFDDQSNKYASWALHNFHYAYSTRYNDFLPGVNVEDLESKKATTPPDLPETLYAAAQNRVGMERELAGYRLSLMLIHIFH